MFDGRMPWHETWDLTQALLSDPTSRVAAAVADWTHPISNESMALRDMYDLLAMVNRDPRRPKPKPYPRPWDPKPKTMGKTDRPKAEVLAILAARGHGIRPPLKRDRNGRLHGDRGRFVSG